ncbi:hypothetical protein LH464_24425 [Neorhizobium sp. T786]|uniref:hypothetical protein n=1 Tax=Pseudorhizobium xiangyangii TaxID=2883104 RepID=UPI001CFFD712|nr:hypothetical protein [Neorhizobium xiangyangii]MCB5205580.1 hypothetical protein [Neorhizobium xiangyangii]
MNRVLINCLNAVNNLLAIVLVAAGALLGYTSGQINGGGLIMVAVGALGGLLAACLVCGLLAVLIEIERHVRQLKGPTL